MELHNDCDGGSCWACAKEARKDNPMTQSIKDTLGRAAKDYEPRHRVRIQLRDYADGWFTLHDCPLSELTALADSVTPGGDDLQAVVDAYQEGFNDAKDAIPVYRDYDWQDGFAQSGASNYVACRNAALQALGAADGWRDEQLQANEKIAFWLSAALDDPNVCDEMKADIERWSEVMPSPPADTGKGGD